MSVPRVLLHLEGLAIAVAAVVVYVHEDASWLLFVVLILAPDLSALGYVAGPRIGSFVYDAFHTTVWPTGLLLVGYIAGESGAVHVALIWLAHIGADRTIGYGLKYPTGFKDTHLQRA